MRAVICSVLMMLYLSAGAETLGPCTELYEKSGAFEFQRFQGAVNCLLLVNPANAGTDYYRSFVLSDEGMLMVFNSYEYAKKTDGSRVFYFFPRTRHPTFQKDNLGRMMVQTSAPGLFLLFDRSLPRISGMLGGMIKEDPKVRPDNKGGVELSNVRTVWLDAGFMLKGDPTADLLRTSIFSDEANQRCEVRNSEIFEVTADGDSYFKFSDAQLKVFLNSRCPRLHVNW